MTSVLDTLSRDYPGDGAWSDYAAAFDTAAHDERSVVTGLVPQDAGLAATLVGVMGHARAVAWLDREIGALDGSSPAQVIASRPDGCRIVRHVLMRMPV